MPEHRDIINMPKPRLLSKASVGMVLAGILLGAFPVLAVAGQYSKLHSGAVVRLNTKNIDVDRRGLAPRLKFLTGINQMSTSQLTGENKFAVNDQAYVFMSPGPNDIWYPYAISKQSPDFDQGTKTPLVLAGTVSSIARDSLAISYGFETIFTSNDFIDSETLQSDGHIKINVDRQGRTTLRSYRIDDDTVDQRNLFKLKPPGSTSLGANIAPATNPPR